MFDLNGFKSINDRFGHAEGDRALVNFAGLMKKSFRTSDVFARLGGDEFVVLLTDTSELEAQRIVKSFDKQLMAINLQSNRGYDIEFCAGIVAVDCHKMMPIDELLKTADTSMYQNKICSTGSDIKR